MPISAEESDDSVRQKQDIASALKAKLWEQMKTCPEHEYCDGTCSGKQIVYDPLLVNPWIKDCINSDPRPRILTANTVCHDETWLQRQNLNDFRYSPLRPGKAVVRLVLIKLANFRKDVIECDMFEVDLKDKPPFAALSYYWGPPQFECHIICNGKKLAITPTLNAALKRVRMDYYCTRETAFGHEYGKNQHPIWVDALCINQNDAEELNSQLGLMRRIYSEAFVVHIDLGHTDLSRPEMALWFQAFSLLEKLSMAAESIGSECKRTADELFYRFAIPDVSHNAWKYFLDIFAMPWFMRTWTVQELVLSKHAYVRFGDFTFPWSHLHESVKMLNRLDFKVARDEVIRGFNHLEILERLIEMRKRGSDDTKLLSLLEMTTDFSVTDPRDKVFAILGLAGSRSGPNTPQFTADYRMSTEALYHRYSIYSVRTNTADQLLHFAGLQRSLSPPRPMPSWVPDWSAQSTFHCPSPTEYLRPKEYNATHGSELCVRLIKSAPDVRSDILVIKGRMVDKIEFVSEPWSLNDGIKNLESMVAAKTFIDWHRAAEEQMFLHGSRVSPQSVYDDVVETFMRTLVMDFLQASARTPAIETLETAYSLALIGLLKVSKGDGAINLSHVKVEDEGTTFLRRMLNACSGRSFAVTQRGYVGLVPRCTEVGSHISLFNGVSVPFITSTLGEPVAKADHIERPMQLVGDAYIHGLMQGEGMDFADCDDEDFWIS